MRVIARRTLLHFLESKSKHHDHKALRNAVLAWFAEAHKARWLNMADIKTSYTTASVISSDRVVFNIKGNDYRLVTAVDFEKSIVWIKWIGTHKDYDKINVKEIKYDG